MSYIKFFSTVLTQDKKKKQDVGAIKYTYELSVKYSYNDRNTIQQNANKTGKNYF